MTSLNSSNYLSELRDLDWDFEGHTGSDGLAGYHWYPARYVPQVPSVLIGYLSSPGETVLDPFCGSGTTLVEAARLQRKPFGIDTNPVAIMMARAKLVPFDRDSWIRYIGALTYRTGELEVANSKQESWLREAVPQFDEQATWYHPETLAELACLFDAIRSTAGDYRVVAEATFSSILRSSSSQQKHWGWICDNVKPAELVYRPATRLFFDKMKSYSNARQSSYDSGGLDCKLPEVAVTAVGDCAVVLQKEPEESVDLVVTSPPYFSMTDYVRSQRLTFLWFGWDLYGLKKVESGARYKRHRKAALEQYLSDMGRAFAQISRVLKAGGSCCVVIGESPSRQPYLDDIRDIMVDNSLKIDMRIRRRVATQRTFAELKHEEIIVARKR